MVSLDKTFAQNIECWKIGREEINSPKEREWYYKDVILSTNCKMYIRKINISNIRSLNNLDIDFSPPFRGWHVIIGDNGAGKSSLIRSVALSLIGPNEARSLRQDWSNWINTQADYASISIQVAPNYEYDFSVSKRKKAEHITNKLVFTNIETVPTISIREIRSESTKMEEEIVDEDPENYNWGLPVIGWFSSAFGPYRRFTGGNKDWEKLSYSNPKVAAHLSAFGEDIALWECIDWLQQLRFMSLESKGKSNDNSGNFIQENESSQLLSRFIGFINYSSLLPNNVRIANVTSQGVDVIDGNGCLVSIYELSDGYRSILSMVFELIIQLINSYGTTKVFEQIKRGFYKIDLPGVVLIDEIDAHLHPKWQSEIGTTLTRIFPNIQFIVTTHSPLICRSVSDESTIWKLSRPGSGNQSQEIVGIEKERLIKGNILEAFDTESFGENITRSKIAQEEILRLAELNRKIIKGSITVEEEILLNHLRSIYPTESGQSDQSKVVDI